ncbi:MAG: hypothetical protein HYS05_19770, partial [Acidobacteria bacterium]|nr:hypothetical protein [Acidobacteriota bacterium]
RLGEAVNVPADDMVQFAAAIGAAWLARRRLTATALHSSSSLKSPSYHDSVR